MLLEVLEDFSEMSIEENQKFLGRISEIVGRKLTVSECYIAFALRDGKYKKMSDVPDSIKQEGI